MNKVEFILLDLIDENENVILEDAVNSYSEADQFLNQVNNEYDHGHVNFTIKFENEIIYKGGINAKEEDNLAAHVMDFAFCTIQQTNNIKIREYYETIINECELL
jgi:hypothetical protein